MEKSEFQDIIVSVFAHSPVGSDDLAGFAHFTNDGVLALYGDDAGKIGFGVASGLTATSDLLSIVSDINRRMSFGHYWLAPGADEANWSLICGFKFAYETVGAEHVIETVVGLMKHNGVLISTVRNALGDIPHRDYWLGDDVSGGAKALVLMGHLG